MDDKEKKLRDQVALWRNLIEGREWQGEEPVYPRMRDALAGAEQNLKQFLLETGRGTLEAENAMNDEGRRG